ncbi:sex-determining region Y protein-like isoform X3 [Linepithema humile]
MFICCVSLKKKKTIICTGIQLRNFLKRTETIMNPSLHNLSSTNLNYTLPGLSDSSTSFSQPAMDCIAQYAMFEDQSKIQISTLTKIKRPMNAFIIWSSKERKKISKEFPQMHNSEISKQLGIMWKTIPQEMKNIYIMKAEELKINHQKKYPNYKFQRKQKKRKESSPNPPTINLIDDKFFSDPLIQNIVPNPYYTGNPNDYAPYLFNVTTTAPFMNNYPNNNTYNNASAAVFANNLVYMNYHTPHSSTKMSFPTTTPANMLYSMFPFASDNKSENHDVHRICNFPQNSPQLSPSDKQFTRTPLSEYNQQQNTYYNL